MARIGQKNYSRYQHYFVDNLSRFYQKRKNRVYGGAILTLVTVSFFALFALKPTANTIAGLLKKIDDQKQVVASLESKINALSQAQQQYSAVSDKLYLIDQAVPPDSQFDELAQQLELIHRQTNVEMVDLKFNKIELWGQESGQLMEVQFSLVAEGQYAELKELLKLFPKLRRIIKIDKFAFQKNQAKNEENVLSLAVGGRAFYLKEVKK